MWKESRLWLATMKEWRIMRCKKDYCEMEMEMASRSRSGAAAEEEEEDDEADAMAAG